LIVIKRRLTGLKGILRYSAMALLLAFALIMAGCGADVGEELLGGTWWADPQLDGDHVMFMKFGPDREYHSIFMMLLIQLNPKHTLGRYCCPV
jgi:hypothetical protein